MTVSRLDEQLSDALGKPPTERLYLDDCLVEDFDYVAPWVPGLLVIRVESEDRRRVWLRPLAFLLAGVSLALAASVARSKDSRKHGASSPASRAPRSRPLHREAVALRRRQLSRTTYRAARRRRHTLTARGSSGYPRPLSRSTSVAPSRMVYVPAQQTARSVPVPRGHRKEFGFER